MALNKKPVTGMKDILPAEMQLRDYCINVIKETYGKFGFTVASTRGIHYYAEPRSETVPYFLIRELKTGFLDGVAGIYRTPEGYFVDDANVNKFDTAFPVKPKLKLPGQMFD